MSVNNNLRWNKIFRLLSDVNWYRKSTCMDEDYAGLTIICQIKLLFNFRCTNSDRMSNLH